MQYARSRKKKKMVSIHRTPSLCMISGHSSVSKGKGKKCTLFVKRNSDQPTEGIEGRPRFDPSRLRPDRDSSSSSSSHIYANLLPMTFNGNQRFGQSENNCGHLFSLTHRRITVSSRTKILVYIYIYTAYVYTTRTCAMAMLLRWRPLPPSCRERERESGVTTTPRRREPKNVKPFCQ